jgi:hypothetical protein
MPVDESSSEPIRLTRATNPFGLPAARIALGCLLLINALGALWRGYQALTIVRRERLGEFLRLFVLYPSLLATVAALALFWLHRRWIVGAVLGCAVLLFHATRLLVDAFLTAPNADGYRNSVERVSGRTFETLIALLLVGAAAVLARSALHFWRQRRMSAAGEQT